jgi:hypothetical protein
MSEAVLEINVTEFKATCLALFKELEARRYDKVVVTRRGRPIVQLTPAQTEDLDPYGCLTGRAVGSRSHVAHPRGHPRGRVWSVAARHLRGDIF